MIYGDKQNEVEMTIQKGTYNSSGIIRQWTFVITIATLINFAD